MMSYDPREDCIPTRITDCIPRGPVQDPSVAGGWLSMEGYLAWVASTTESNSHELEESLRQEDPPCLIFEGTKAA